MIPALVIGGEQSFVLDKLAPNLARHNIEILDVWPWDKEAGSVPEQTEMMFFLTDMMSHRHNDAAKAEAVKRNIPVVYGVRKWSISQKRLMEAGFPERKPEGIAVNSTVAFRYSNPTLPDGYYRATVMTVELDAEKMFVILRIEDGPKIGLTYSDTLITKDQWQTKTTIERFLAFARSLGIKRKFEWDAEGLETVLLEIEQAVMRRSVYFYKTGGNAPVPSLTFMENSAWLAASARQRRKRGNRDAPPAQPVLPLDTTPQETPNMPDIRTQAAEPVSPSPSQTFLISPSVSDLFRQRFDATVKLLAIDPRLTSVELAERLQTTARGNYPTIYRQARELLGIRSLNPNQVTLDRKKYDAACKTLHIVPIKGGPVFDRAPVEARVSKKSTPAPVDTLNVIQPIPESTPAPAPEKNVQEANVVQFQQKAKNQSVEMDELKEIIALLREEMAKRDIRRLVVSPEGVAMTRVVVVEDTLDI